LSNSSALQVIAIAKKWAIGQSLHPEPTTHILLSILLVNMSETDVGFVAAVEEAKKGYEEGGVPIGRPPRSPTKHWPVIVTDT
jgi:hypothetical protein